MMLKQQIEKKPEKDLEDRISVLLVDDNKNFLDITERYLGKYFKHIDLKTTQSPEESLKILENENIECILSDYDMPEMDGITMLERVREKYPELPFILITSKGSEEVASEAISKGVTDYIQKESNKDQFRLLVNRIRNAVSKSRIEAKRKQMEESLEAVADGVYILNDDREFIMANNALTEITEHEREELISAKLDKIADKETINNIEREQEKLEGEREIGNIETTITTADEEEIPVEIRFRSYSSGSIENGRISVVRDISKRKEERKNLEQHRSLTEAASEAIMTIDEESIIDFVNPAIEDILGYKPEEVEGQPLSMLIPEDMREPHLQGTKDYLQTNEKNLDWDYIELPGQHKDGHRVMLGISFSEFQHNGDHYFTGFARDITERKKREKMLKEFSSIVSHDLKNPLTTAQGYLDMALELGEEDDIRSAKEMLQKMNNIIEDLQMMTLRPERIRKEELELKDLFQEAHSIVDVKPGYDVENTTVKVGRSGFVRLLSNLIENSVEHNSEPVHIEVGPLEDGFYYQDDGKGIPEEEREKVFEHGYTTSEIGSGLGLTIAKRIADANKWSIDIKESPEGGARFEFRPKDSS